MVSAIFLALPSALLICSAREAKSLSDAFTIASNPDIPSCPAKEAASCVFCASDNLPKPVRSSPKTSLNGFMLPFASVRDTPSVFIASFTSSVGFTIRESSERNAVPAWLALIPLFAIRPSANDTSSMLYFIAPATGATYLKDSPSIATSVLEADEAMANTSEKCAASLACNPKAVMESVTISETIAKSSPEAAARFITPSMPFSISSVFQPAIAMYSKACADSVAEYFVSMPICFAFSVSAVISSPVAPEIASTLDICASKSIPALTA